MTPTLSVLVVDDNAGLCSALGTMLRVAGHRPLIATDGEEASRILQSQPVDVVLTDILMPEKDGLALIQEIHRTRPSLPVIAMSGGGRFMDRGYCLHAASFFGATTLLTKPFGRDEMLAAIDEAIGLSSTPAS